MDNLNDTARDARFPAPWTDDPILPDGWREGEDLTAAVSPSPVQTPAVPTSDSQPDNKRVYHLKVNHQERDVALSDDEVIQRLQKSYAFDEWKQPADLTSQVTRARRLFPDLTEIPPEVAESVANGSPFLSAYTAYRVRESERESNRLRLENEILRQNQEAMRRAPVRGVTASGSVRDAPLSDFERGFDSDGW